VQVTTASSWSACPTSINRHTLRQRRIELHLPLRAAAERLDRPINAVARLEKRIVHDPKLARRYEYWLTQHSTD